MSEGISENPPPKKRVRVLPKVRILPVETEHKPSTFPSLEQNIRASEQFIRALRTPNSYRQDQEDPGFMKSDLGFKVEKGVGVERGYFDLASAVRTTEERYNLPLTIYVKQSHARLVVKGPYNTSEGRKIKVYDPMISGFSEIKVNDTGQIAGLLSNGLAFEKRTKNQGDLTAFLESPDLARFNNLLTDIKAFGFQMDFYNCIPYCLFVGAMLNGLEPGTTAFKQRGIKQFEQDFGIRILTREEMTPKPRVRVSK